MPGHNNWIDINLKLGVDNSKLPFTIDLAVPPVTNLNFEQASNATANLIANTFDNLHLCLSGGMDSEYVAQVLLRNKIPFTPVLLNTGTYTDELWYAKHFCYRQNIKPLVLDYSTRYNKLLHTILKYSNAASLGPGISFFPHVIADYLAANNGSLITGYGDTVAYHEPLNDYNDVVIDDIEIDAWDFYLDLSFSNKHPGGFFSYTPDMFFSTIKSLPMGINIQAAKEKLYQVAGRSKITMDLALPSYIPERVRKLKEGNRKCIKISRTELLHLIKTQSSIKLSSV